MRNLGLLYVGVLLVMLAITVLALPASAQPIAQSDSPLPPGDPSPPPPSEGETLKLVLLWVLGGSGAGAIAYWLLEHVGWLAALPSEYKRYAALLMSAGLACLAFVAAVYLEYKPDPGNWQSWLEQLFAIAYLALTINQGLHGLLKLRA